MFGAYFPVGQAKFHVLFSGAPYTDMDKFWSQRW